MACGWEQILFEMIRREHRDGASIRVLADDHRVHRLTVCQAINNAKPPSRKTPERDALAAVMYTNDEINNSERAQMTSWDLIVDTFSKAAAEGPVISLENVTERFALLRIDESTVMFELQSDEGSNQWLIVMTPVGFIPENGLRSALVDCSISFASGLADVEGIATLRTVLPLDDLPMSVLWRVISASVGTARRLEADHATT